MTTKTNYYNNQLKAVSKKSNFAPTIVLSNEHGKTNYMDVNEESAPVFIEWLSQFKAPPTTQELERELTSNTETWVNKSFNFIQKDVYEKTLECGLYEYIRQSEQDNDFYSDYFDNYGLWDEFKQYLKDNEEEDSEEVRKTFSEDETTSFDSYVNDQEQDNYPMWNTLFEFRSEPSEEIIQSCIDAGFGIIEGMDDFNTTLFVSGCGYSFYAQHWMPLWLSLPYTDNEKYKNTSYSHL